MLLYLGPGHIEHERKEEKKITISIFLDKKYHDSTTDVASSSLVGDAVGHDLGAAHDPTVFQDPAVFMYVSGQPGEIIDSVQSIFCEQGFEQFRK